MITIINYGLGNVQAFANLYKRLNIPAVIASSAAGLEGATKLILPGVGAFDHAMELFDGSGMRETVDELVLKQRRPVLGVCVGMQILARGSDEGKLAGLGWVDVVPKHGAGLFAGLEQDARFYFLHSYYFDCASSEHVLATSEYGSAFGCAVHSD